MKYFCYCVFIALSFTDLDSLESADRHSLFPTDGHGNLALNSSLKRSPLNERISKRTLNLKTPDICDPTVQQYSGFLDLFGGNHLYFHLFYSRDNPETDPLIILLNGGVGVSSLPLMFMGAGPCAFGLNQTLTYNPNSWNKNASLLFIDQSVGTGFSYGESAPSTTPEAADTLYDFMVMFYKQFPSFLNCALHIFAEALAANMASMLAKAILEYEKTSDSLIKIPLASIGISNGFYDHRILVEYWWSVPCAKKKLISYTNCSLMEDYLTILRYNFEKCYEQNKKAYCYSAATNMFEMLLVYQEEGNSPYDIYGKCRLMDHCYPDFNKAYNLFNDPLTQKKIGTNADYMLKNNTLNGDLEDNLDDFIRLKPYYEYLLDRGLPVLMYSGANSYICNYESANNFSKSLDWTGKAEYNGAAFETWVDSKNKQKLGMVKLYKNLALVVVDNAGYIPTHDKPKESKQLLDKWLLYVSSNCSRKESFSQIDI